MRKHNKNIFIWVASAIGAYILMGVCFALYTGNTESWNNFLAVVFLWPEGFLVSLLVKGFIESSF
jgi:ABC-type sugar transport system permease subunit